MVRIISMNPPNNPAEREQELRKIIRSLSKVSEVETREVRASVERDSRLRNRNRRRREVEEDSLLRERRGVVLPNLLSSYRLFMSSDKKIESIKQRYIDSQAFLKRANFQSKKIQLKKQEIAHKQYRADQSHASAPHLSIQTIENGKTNMQNDPFAMLNHHAPNESDAVLIKRLKTTVDSSHKEMKNLYQSHARQVASLPFRKRIATDPSNQDFLSVASKQSEFSGPQIKPTKSVILLPSARKPKKTVKQLIKLSSFRSRQDERGSEPTTKEQEQQAQTERIILELQAGIEEGNRLKETLVLGQLKKLLYGDRRGRFIQDSTFRTRLRGEYSEQYMKIVQEQQNILNAFQGSYFNRKNLVEKFANILGTLRTNASHEEHELVLS